MKDAQNLAKLLGHLPPKPFRAFMYQQRSHYCCSNLLDSSACISLRPSATR